jgi:nitrate/nitrite-specific signal transduction histidine kinase
MARSPTRLAAQPSRPSMEAPSNPTPVVRLADMVEVHDQALLSFSRVIHDGLAQSLTGVSLLVQALSTDLEARDGAGVEADMSRAIVEQLMLCVAQVRALSRMGDPARVTRESFATALDDLITILPLQRRRLVSIEVDPPPAWLGAEDAVRLVRFAAQALQICATATQNEPLKVELHGSAGHLSLAFSGSAMGQLLEARKAGALSWLLLRERAASLGAGLSCEPRPAVGARLELTMAPRP